MNDDTQQPYAGRLGPARHRAFALTALALAVALLAGGVAAYVVTRPAGGPAPLRLTDIGPAGTGSATGPGGDAAGTGDTPAIARAPETTPGAVGTFGGLRLEARLPDGPDRAAVRRWTATADRDDVAALARALGLRASVETSPEAWTVSGGRSGSLQVARSAGDPWTFTRDPNRSCLPVPLPDPARPTRRGAADATVSCAVPPPTGKPIPAEAARAQAEPVLRALGLDATRARIYEGPTTSLQVDPVIDGLATSGAATDIGVDEHGISWASGWLGGTEAGASYPLITAAAAFTTMAEAPRAEPAIECVRAPCEPAPTVVTGAELGLVARFEVDGPVLVPAWLFRAGPAGSSARTLAWVAVEPRYLRPARNDDPGDPGGSGSTGGSGGSGDAGEPTSVEPAPPVGVAPDAPPTRESTRD